MGFSTKVKPNYSQASFATEEDIRKYCDCIDLQKEGSGVGGGIVVISDGKKAYTADREASSIIVGGTGSKKTRNVVTEHVLSSAYAGNSLIVHDPKADIYKHTKKYLEKKGYKIYVLNYRNPDFGDCFNPLQFAAELYKNGKQDRARELMMNFANTIFQTVRSEKDAFWHITAAGFFAGLCETLCLEFETEQVSIDNIYNLHLQGEDRIRGVNCLKHYFDKHSDERCWKLIYPVISAPNETRSSLYAVFGGALTNYVQNDAVVRQTSSSSFSVEDLVNEKSALFLITRDEGTAYDALLTATIDLIYSLLVDIADRNDGKLSRNLTFILDEFGNMAPMPYCERKISLSRARGISFNIVCQSFEQLSLVYGKERASVILGNCNNIVYLHSNDISIVKYISALCGERDGDTISDIKLPLCSVHLLRHLDKESGECLMLLNRMNPFITRLLDISEYYGYEPLDKLDLKERDRKNVVPINFRERVLKLLSSQPNPFWDGNLEKSTSQEQKRSVQDKLPFDDILKPADKITEGEMEDKRRVFDENEIISMLDEIINEKEEE